MKHPHKITALILTTAMILPMATSFTGCSSTGGGSVLTETTTISPEEEASAAAEEFMKTLISRDYDSLNKISDPKILEDSTFAAYCDTDYWINMLFKDCEVAYDDLSDETKESVRTFIDTALCTTLRDYEIKEVKVGSSDKAEILMSVSMANMNESKVSSYDFQKLAEDYITENPERIRRIYQNQGEYKVMVDVYDAIMPAYIKTWSESLKKVSATPKDYIMQLEKQDGRYVVCTFNEKL